MNKTLTLALLSSFIALPSQAMDPEQKRDFMINASRIARGHDVRRMTEKLKELDNEEEIVEELKKKTCPYDSDSDSIEEISAVPAPLPIIPFPTSLAPGQNMYINYNIQITQNLRNSHGKVNVTPPQTRKQTKQ